MVLSFVSFSIFPSLSIQNRRYSYSSTRSMFSWLSLLFNTLCSSLLFYTLCSSLLFSSCLLLNFFYLIRFLVSIGFLVISFPLVHNFLKINLQTVETSKFYFYLSGFENAVFTFVCTDVVYNLKRVTFHCSQTFLPISNPKFLNKNLSVASNGCNLKKTYTKCD